jgi:hypothetical protein
VAGAARGKGNEDETAEATEIGAIEAIAAGDPF